MRLQNKLALFNLLSKLVFSALFIAFLPLIVERINTMQTDRELIDKREQVINLISAYGLEPFLAAGSDSGFGSYNILKEEFINLEKADLSEDWNFIEVATRKLDNETIDYRVLNYSFRIDGQTYLLEIGKSLKSIKQTGRNIRSIILIFLVLFITVTLLSDLFYTSRILKPLRIITGRLKATSAPSLGRLLPVETNTDDFRQLDQTLRDLMERIDELFRKEKEITVNISHELLTPVSVLRSKLENLLLKEGLDPETEAGIEDSLRTLHRLKSLVNSLLMIARLESRQYLREDEVNISGLMAEIREELLPVAEDSGVKIELSCPGDFTFIKANRSLLFSMFYNVFNNALRHTTPSGTIEIRGRQSAGSFVISIADSGSGMVQEQLDNLFSRFKTRLDPGTDNSGIGLAIAKSIADFHGIEVEVSSKIGEGTTFMFLFPKNS